MVRKPLQQTTCFLLLVLAAAPAVVAEDDSPTFTRLSPAGLADSQKLWGYSQVIVTEPGARTVYVAGSTGDDENGVIVHPNDFEKQVELTFQNIRTSLAAAGATGEDVVRVRLYIVDFDAEKHWPIVGSAMARHLGDKGPVATMVGIQALAEPGILFEADVTAVIR
jgi:enamine deaminase RidA (YjgF/YER057c/UK114 family)